MKKAATYREIPLTQGKVAIVDDADYEWFIQWKWYAKWNPYTKSYYAMRNLPRSEAGTVQMHRQILALNKGDIRQGDHVNHDTLNNQRSNLRVATPSDNQRNKRMYANNTSGYKGVGFHKATGKWSSNIRENNKPVYLGLFLSAHEAAQAYNNAAMKLHGEFAVLNTIEVRRCEATV